MKKTVLALCIVLCFAANALAQPSIRLSAVSWDPGEVPEGKVLKERVTISNIGSEPLEVNIRAGCSCISFDRSKKTIAPGREAKLTIKFNTKDKKGKLSEYVFFDTNDPEFPNITFFIDATVNAKPSKRTKKDKAVLSQDKAGSGIPVLMFSSPGCSTCRKLKDKFIPKLEDKYGLEVTVQHLTTNIPENYEKLIDLETTLDDKNNKLPALVIGNIILGGEKEIRKKLGKIFKSIRDTGYSKLFGDKIETVTGDVQEKISSIKLLPIIGAGLLDGINPCAFATIIFFISYLAFAGRGGKEILSTGISFTLAIFLSYTLIGLGAITIIEKLTGVLPVVALIIKIITVTMVLILGCISIYDYIKCRQGKPREMKLQLSPLLKDKIHKSITSKREDFSGKDSKVLKLAVAGFSVGVLVSIFEFACTGQVYLPTIIYMLKLPGLRFGAFGWLLLYNLMFVIPLIVIFILAWKGVTSEQFTEIMLKHISKVKIGMAIFFFGMGVLLIFT